MDKIDWSKAPVWASNLGTVSGDSVFYNNSHYQYCQGDNNKYSMEENGYDYEDFCSEDVRVAFIDCKVSDKTQTLTYTQAMADKGELPSVGMMFIDVEYNVNKPVLAIAHDLPMKRVVYKSDNDDPEYFGAIASECKPIIPPIELIDGKAYQFYIEEATNIFHGIWSKERQQMCTEHSYFLKRVCEGIQPLTVKE
jgi:hypothetical protein